MILALNIFGRFLSILPDWAIQGFCVVSSWIWRTIMPSRFACSIRNIQKAYPEKSRQWARKKATKSYQRSVEMALFAFVSPHWSTKKFKEKLSFPGRTQQIISDWKASQRPKLFLIPHTCLSEMVAHVFTQMDREAMGELGCLFRPLNQKSLDDWVKKSREKNGSELLSRKKGIHRARAILRNNGGVGIFYDQRAGGTGTLLMALGRVTSVTDLPALLLKETKASVYFVIPERLATFKSQIDLVPINDWKNSAEVIIRGNYELDKYLLENPEKTQDWLWAHDRWRTHYKPSQRLTLSHKRTLIKSQMDFMNWNELPQKNQIWIRMPFEFESFIAAMYFAQAVMRGRPDSTISLVGPAFGGWITNNLNSKLRYKSLKIPFVKKFSQHLSWRKSPADTLIVLQPGIKTAIESRVSLPIQPIGFTSNKGHKLLKNKVDDQVFTDNPFNEINYLNRYKHIAESMGLEPENFQIAPILRHPIPSIGLCEDVYVIFKDEGLEKKVISTIQSISKDIHIHTFRFQKPDPVPTSLLWPEIFSNFHHRQPVIITDQFAWCLCARLFELSSLYLTFQGAPDPQEGMKSFEIQPTPHARFDNLILSNRNESLSEEFMTEFLTQEETIYVNKVQE